MRGCCRRLGCQLAAAERVGFSGQVAAAGRVPAAEQIAAAERRRSWQKKERHRRVRIAQIFSIQSPCQSVGFADPPARLAARRRSSREWQPAVLTGLPELAVQDTPRSLSQSKTLFWSADGVSDRGADSNRVVRVELVGVALDVVVVNFGSHEHVTPNIIAETAAEVFHEVVAAGVVDTSAADVAAHYLVDVEACAADADTAKDVDAKFLSQTWLVKGVKVRENGAKRYPCSAAVVALVGPPGGSDVKAEALPGHDVAVDVNVAAAVLRWGEGGIAGGGRQNGAAADHNIPLLGRGKLGEEQECTNGCEDR
jgi:hypothetical protein